MVQVSGILGKLMDKQILILSITYTFNYILSNIKLTNYPSLSYEKHIHMYCSEQVNSFDSHGKFQLEVKKSL